MDAVRSLADDKDDPDLDQMMAGNVSDSMLKRIEEATKVIGELVMEVSKDVFVADPNLELSAETAAKQEREAVQRAVMKRMHTLDEAFLVTLGGFVQASAQNGDEAMHRRLAVMHEAVVREVKSRLPTEVQLLDSLIGNTSTEERETLLRQRLRGSSSEKAVDAVRLDAAASQFIDDMEDKAEVPDRRLLARVCLVREEIQNGAREEAFRRGRDFGDFFSDASAKARGGVPRRALAFLQAVMKVGEKQGRLAYLRKAFVSDWEGAAPQRSGSGSVSEGDEKSDAVRPGRFLTALNTTQSELTQDGANVAPGVLERLEDVRRETLEVLQEMAAAKPQ